MKLSVIALMPAEKPWSTPVGALQAGAAMALILAVTLGAKLFSGALSTAGYFFCIALCETAGALAAWLLALPPGAGGSRRGILGAEPPRLRHCGWLAAAPFLIWIGSAVLGAGWAAVLRRLGIPFDEIQPLIAEIRNFDGGDYLLVLAGVGVMTPAAEEFFFRRLLYGVLEPLGVWRAALATSVLFAAAHGFLFGFPGLFWMGMIFQLVYCRCRNLGAPIFVHAVINCVALAGARAGWLS